MKRPCICIVAGIALGEVFAYAISGKDIILAVAVGIALLISCAIISGLINKRRAALVIGIAFFVGLVRLLAAAYLLQPISGYEGETAAVIKDITMKNERLTLRCHTVNTSFPGNDNGIPGQNDDSFALQDNVHASAMVHDSRRLSDINTDNGLLGKHGDILVYYEPTESDSFAVGNTILIQGEFAHMDTPSNPGEFNYRLYYLADNVTGRCFANRVTVTDPSVNFFGDLLYRTRILLLSQIDSVFNEDDAGVLRSVLLGDKSELSDDLYDMYRKNGIAHLLAISGLHVGIIGMSVYKILRQKCKLAYGLCGLISGVWALFYCFLTGMGVSTLRATIMLLISFLAGVLGRRADTLNSAGLAGIIILLIWPYQLFNCAFLLSFGCIIAISGPAMEIISQLQLRSGILKAIILSLTIQLFTLPITAYFFFEVSLYGCILNLIVIPLMTIVVWSSLMATLISLVSPIAAAITGAAGHYILKLYTFLGGIASSLPFSSILIGRPSIWQICVYYFLFFSVLYFFRLKEMILHLPFLTSGRETGST